MCKWAGVQRVEGEEGEHPQADSPKGSWPEPKAELDTQPTELPRHLFKNFLRWKFSPVQIDMTNGTFNSKW